ncbi:OsmC family protein [Marinicrinis sediminis]|uniref:OsmC family protein n=1 Tax=Marinicrinis sediminis TaxID=1652465 RepID=A0ABW5R8K1_9BACL
MKIEAQWQGKMAFTAKGPTEYELRMDAGIDHGGEGSGHSPMELLLLGLSGCMGINITAILDKMQQPVDSLKIEITGHQAEDWPKNFTGYDFVVIAEGKAPADRVWRAMKMAEEKYCSVSNSLHGGLKMSLVLNGKPVNEVDAVSHSEA